jgi:hypothetical protein
MGAQPFPDSDKVLLTWWHTFGPTILNDFEFTVDELNDKARVDELQYLATIIKADANIDDEDVNVQRILRHISVFIEQLEEEIEYETIEDLDKAGENNERMEKNS